MIIVRLMGGIGNQMFQYALGRRLALDRDVPLTLDLSWFNSQNKRVFELDQFNIHAELAESGYIEKFLPFSPNRFIRGVYNGIEKWFPYNARFLFREQHAGYFDASVLKVTGNRILQGYWQSEKYFKPIEAQIRADFAPKQPLSAEDRALAGEMRSNPHSVSVHIRRSDYVANYRIIKTHYVCTPDYYNETMRLIHEKLGGKAFFYVFSDDPEWCRSGVNYPAEYKIVSNNERSEARELSLMTCCHHAIIANSSFSWWGAWLSDKPEKIVIYPQIWFYNHPTPDIPLKNWQVYQHDTANDWKYIDIPYAKSRFKKKYDRELDLDNPQTFSEKLQWLKIYDRRPIYQTVADKYAVRDYVAQKIGEQYLTKLYGVYEQSSAIEWKKLPDKFVLKANHGCGWNILCKNKTLLNTKKTCQQLDNWLSFNYYYLGREWHYKNIPPRIICEEFLEGNKDFGLLDYKLFCFHGQPRYVQVDIDRFTDHKRAIYTLDWQPVAFILNHPQIKYKIPRPDQLEQMIELAKILSNGLTFVRVDLYYPEGRIIFGELTLYPEAGYPTIRPREYDNILGRDLKLPC